MLNTKKLLTKTLKMMKANTGAVSSLSDFITFNSGWSGSSISAVRYGNLLFFEIVIQKNNFAPGGAETVGTLKSDYVPLLTCPLMGANVMGFVSGGDLYARNIGSTTSAAQRICGILILGGGVLRNLIYVNLRPLLRKAVVVC